MIVLFIVVALLSVLILWVVFVPVYVIANTRLDIYMIRQAGTFVISLSPGEVPVMNVKVFGIGIRPPGQKPVDKAIRPQTRKKHISKKSPEAWLFLLKGMLNSFTCKKFECTIDLGDVVLNAQMVPLMIMLSSDPVRLSVNFRGENVSI